METFIQDLRYVLRTLFQRPGFTAAVIVTLGLGIASTTAIFSVVNAILLRPLPFEGADQLVTPNVISTQGFAISLSIPNYYDWKDQTNAWESFGASRATNAVMTDVETPEVVGVRQVLGDFFRVLRVDAAHGRVITAAESEPGAVPLAVITNGFWQRRFGGSADAIAGALTLDGIPFTIIGPFSDQVGATCIAHDSRKHLPCDEVREVGPGRVPLKDLGKRQER